MPSRITLLGATGSIGKAACEFLQNYPDKFDVAAISGHRNVARLVEISDLLKPELVVISDENYFDALKQAVSSATHQPRLAAGKSGLQEAATIKADRVLAAIVGAAGLSPTLQAAKSGASIALANKECLVMAGKFLMQSAHEILPVDSEHNAIFQVLSDKPNEIKEIILTSSGGAFREFTRKQMQHITPEQAMHHPNWSMGAKISVDSATMMNKALELIEAKHLFSMPAEKLKVIIHPQQIIHSMVRYCDGTILAQMGVPNMYLPVAHTLSYPHRLPAPAHHQFDFTDTTKFDFSLPDKVKFPALNLAEQILNAGQASAIIFNAANEIAVEAFLQKRISYLAITDIITRGLDEYHADEPKNLDDVILIDNKARQIVEEIIKKID
ncbi:MAG: 1-deoxy-D-xylulose-5-phosphate reductoisomerase [Alphaproteobacteria bacterium]|nr:1-deoxy-D-xylulose-5-phosphate reductoisomerase [Alphaproteobacteria bacterium]